MLGLCYTAITMAKDTVTKEFIKTRFMHPLPPLSSSRAGRLGITVQIPLWARFLCLLQRVDTGSGAHPASYAIDTGFIPWGNAAEA
jgi:hypothetical protein